MESGRSVKDIAQNLCEYMSSVSPQVDEQGKLQYYMCGSLATMLLSNAISVERCSVTGELVESSLEEKVIPQEARETLSLFARPIHDIDVINVAGNVVENSKITVDGRVKNRMLRAPVQRAVPDVEQLFRRQSDYWSAFANIDSLEEERNINKHRVAKITMEDGTELYITSPEALIAHKLDETIQLVVQKNDEEKYAKDIRDLATMIGGISKIYDKKELSKAVFDTIQEKDGSHFYEYRTKLAEVFQTITGDIRTYISEAGLQDTLGETDISDVLEDVQSLGANTEKDVSQSAIKVATIAAGSEQCGKGEADSFISKLRDGVKTIREMAEEVGKTDGEISRGEVVKTPVKDEI